jgi:alanyl-tRNA synthetase
LKEKSRIVKILDADKGRKILLLESSVFHPSGGGQPGDSGKISCPEFKGQILDTVMTADGKGHVTKITRGQVAAGLDVVVELDVKRHDVLTRMHSAQHLISRILENKYAGLYTKKVNVGESESSISITYDGVVDWQMLFETEDLVNEIISQKRKVTIRTVGYEDARKIEGLKIKWDRIPPDEDIRIVTIEDLDIMACSGSHVQDTGEIPHVMISGFKGSKPEWEIKFDLSWKEKAKEYSRIIRSFSREVGCPPQKLSKTYSKLQEDNKACRKQIERLRQYIEIPWKEEEAGDKRLYSAVLTGLTKDILLPGAKKKAIEDPDGIVVVLMLQDDDHPSSFILLQGENCSMDLGRIIRLPELKAKGGGDSTLVTGVTLCDSITIWKQVILSGK